MRHARPRVLSHVVVLAQPPCGRGEWRGEAREVAAAEGREAREARGGAADRVARDGHVVVDHRVHERAVAERAPGGAGGVARVREDAPEVLRVRARREADGIGPACRHLDDLAARRGDLDRHLGDLRVLVPLEPAREPVAVHRLTREVGLHRRQVTLEARDRILAPADPLHRRVAASDAEDRPPAALHLERQRRRRRHRGVARDRVADPRSETDPLGRLRCEHELAPHLGREVLTVREEQGVEAERLEPPCGVGGSARAGDREDADVHPTRGSGDRSGRARRRCRRGSRGAARR